MDPGMRYRCGACGNLTRFDVEAQRHTKRFLHYTLAGDATVEDEDVIAEQILRVTCRWCGSSDQIEEVPRVGSG